MRLHASHAGLTKTEQKIREAQLSGSEGYSPLRTQVFNFHSKFTSFAGKTPTP